MCLLHKWWLTRDVECLPKPPRATFASPGEKGDYSCAPHHYSLPFHFTQSNSHTSSPPVVAERAVCDMAAMAAAQIDEFTSQPHWACTSRSIFSANVRRWSRVRKSRAEKKKKGSHSYIFRQRPFFWYLISLPKSFLCQKLGVSEWVNATMQPMS